MVVDEKFVRSLLTEIFQRIGPKNITH
jgi:hypothetical protein